MCPCVSICPLINSLMFFSMLCQLCVSMCPFAPMWPLVWCTDGIWQNMFQYVPFCQHLSTNWIHWKFFSMLCQACVSMCPCAPMWQLVWYLVCLWKAECQHVCQACVMCPCATMCLLVILGFPLKSHVTACSYVSHVPACRIHSLFLFQSFVRHV